MTPAEAARTSATAVVGFPDGPRTVPLALQGGGSVPAFAGTFPTDGVSVAPVSVEITGDRRRLVTASLVVADGRAHLRGIGADRLVDEDGDGHPDDLVVDVRVDTSVAGAHNVALDVRDATGTPVPSAGSLADLSAGESTVPVHVPVADLLAGGCAGPFVIANATLAHGTPPTLAESRDVLGTLATTTVCDAASGHVGVTRPVGALRDDDADGRVDGLRFTATVFAPAAGAYAMQGTITGPDGTLVEVQDLARAVDAGANEVTVDVTAAQLAAHGPGRYELVLSAGPEDSFDDLVDSPPGSVVLPPPATMEGLIQQWDDADARGAISSHGLYVSERERLLRVQRAMASGSVTVARRELDRFFADVRTSRDVVADTATAIADYATRVRATIGR
jgi:hypothetical protein